MSQQGGGGDVSTLTSMTEEKPGCASVSIMNNLQHLFYRDIVFLSDVAEVRTRITSVVQHDNTAYEYTDKLWNIQLLTLTLIL